MRTPIVLDSVWGYNWISCISRELLHCLHVCLTVSLQDLTGLQVISFPVGVCDGLWSEMCSLASNSLCKFRSTNGMPSKRYVYIYNYIILYTCLKAQELSFQRPFSGKLTLAFGCCEKPMKTCKSMNWCKKMCASNKAPFLVDFKYHLTHNKGMSRHVISGPMNSLSPCPNSSSTGAGQALRCPAPCASVSPWQDPNRSQCLKILKCMWQPWIINWGEVFRRYK